MNVLVVKYICIIDSILHICYLPYMYGIQSNSKVKLWQIKK